MRATVRQVGIVALVCSAALSPHLPARACSAFALGRGAELRFGKNYDWHFGNGVLLVNARKALRRAAPTGAGPPVVWEARYGSVTFNQYGRFFPAGGINERGLVIELMWHEGARYPAPDERPSIGASQWIQYQLDTAANVPEVLASDHRLRIESEVPLHYLIADAGGRVAAVEFLDGELVASADRTLPVPVLTNSGYAESLRHLRRLESSEIPPGTGNDSLSRFARLADHLEATGEEFTVDEAFDALGEAAQGAYTQWRLVYEPARRTVHYRTRRNEDTRTVHLDRIDFACDGPTLGLDLETGAGDVSGRLEPLHGDWNLELMQRSFARTSFLADVRTSELERLASQAGEERCIH